MSIKIKIFDMQCFLALFHHKNFTKAAQSMCISQPPFSRIIQKIELNMKGTLIERSKKSFVLTPLGKEFLKESQKLVQAYEKSMSYINTLQATNINNPKVGFTSLVTHIPGFYELINTISDQTLEISLREISCQDLYKKLKTYEIDILITHFVPNPSIFQVRRVKSCNTAVLLPHQICCFREQFPYHIILNDNKVDKTYNEFLLNNFTKYNLRPIYRESSQLSPQLALQGRGILIYPEPTAKIVNINDIFTLENINDSNDLFGIYIITKKNIFDEFIENIVKNLTLSYQHRSNNVQKRIIQHC